MRLPCLLLAIVLVFLEGKGISHEAEEASAGITLRDQAVEVRLNVELASWIQNITGLSLSVEHPPDMEPLLILAASNLKQSVLRVGNANVPLEIVQFPKAADVLHEASGHGHAGHLRATILMRGALTKAPSGTVSLEVPKEIGPIIMSFSQPKTIWVASGAAGVFKMDEPRVEKKAPRSKAFPWALSAAAVFGVLAVGLWLRSARWGLGKSTQ